LKIPIFIGRNRIFQILSRGFRLKVVLKVVHINYGGETKLENFGLTVTVKTASAAVSGDATGKRVVVISESVTPAKFHSYKKCLSPDVNENLEFRLMNNCV